MTADLKWKFKKARLKRRLKRIKARKKRPAAAVAAQKTAQV